jgi:predicted permease
VTTFLSDLRFSARLMRKAPGFTVVAVATLALGIGANTAIFSVVNAALLSSLPYPHPDRLVAVWTTVQRQDVERRGSSYPDYRDLRDRSQSFDAFAAWTNETLTLASTGSGAAQQVQAELVSAPYFTMLGATPVAGRTFTDQEDAERGAHPVAVISYAFWQHQFAGDPATVGRAVRLNDRPVTLIGVLPKGFAGLADDTDLWIPMGMMDVAEPARFYDRRGARWHQIVARLKPGVSIDRATADVAGVARQLEQSYPDTNAKYSASVFSLKDETVGQLQPLLLTLLGAVAFVLLIACVNLANLLLARAAARQRETAIRAALGADRLRLVWQFIAEGLLLATIGAAAGLLLALWSVDAIVAITATGLPSFVHPHLDWRVLGFVCLVTSASALLLGLVPAVQASHADLNDVLKEGARGSAGRMSARLRSALVVAEVALSLLLLIGAGLMVRTFMNLQTIDLGFRPERAYTTQLALPSKYADDRVPQAVEHLVNRLGGIAGVRHVAAGTDAPLNGASSAVIVSPEARVVGSPDGGVRVYQHSVTPGFFDAIGTRLIAGRDFDGHDATGTLPVAIVSRSFAAKVWPDVDPVGRRFRFGRGNDGEWITIVGVAADVRYRSLIADVNVAPEDPDLYVPFAQAPSHSLAVVVSSDGDPAPLASAVRDTLLAIDRDIPVYRESTMRALVARRTAPYRVSAGMMSFFGGVALLLAGIGVYGLINYSVAQRRQEIGVRVALGAGRREIYALVLKDALLLTAAGLSIGAVAAVCSARVIGTQLYGVTPTDPLTYVTIAALLLVVAVAATLVPARRAARVDPIIALRAD